MSTQLSEKKRLKKSLKIQVDYNQISTYEELKSNIRPFDLIGFRGGDLVSDFITVLEEKNYDTGVFSHVGMVVTSEILSHHGDFELVPGKIYVFESTFSYKIGSFMDNAPDITTGNGKLGAQLRDLEDVIPRYITNAKTKVAWCKLLNNPLERRDESIEEYEDRRQELIRKFKPLFDTFANRQYEVSLISLFGAMFPSLRLFRNARDACYNGLYKALSWFGCDNENCPSGWQFCSELVGNMYQGIGVIDESFDPRDILPIDFLGYDVDGLPALVEAPIFIQDWDIQDHPAYSDEKIE